MFAQVAPRYDLLNRLLSLGVDRRWRRAAVRWAGVRPGERALDCCAGTGDLALELARAGCHAVGADFCLPMLRRARGKAARARRTLALVAADALRLPFADASFDLVTVAFGLRNLESPGAGLAEMARVLRGGGRLVVLEFARPTLPVLRQVYLFYFQSLLPRIGALAGSGNGAAYSYLPASVMDFPDRGQVTDLLEGHGFTHAQFRLLTGGIAALYKAVRTPIPPEAAP